MERQQRLSQLQFLQTSPPIAVRRRLHRPCEKMGISNACVDWCCVSNDVDRDACRPRSPSHSRRYPAASVSSGVSLSWSVWSCGGCWSVSSSFVVRARAVHLQSRSRQSRMSVSVYGVALSAWDGRGIYVTMSVCGLILRVINYTYSSRDGTFGEGGHILFVLFSRNCRRLYGSCKRLDLIFLVDSTHPSVQSDPAPLGYPPPRGPPP